MTTEIKQVVNCGVNIQESLTLVNRLESSECRTTHAPLPNPGSLVGKLSSIISVLRCIVNDIRNQFTMCNAITSQLIRYDLPWLTGIIPQQPFEKALGGLAVSR